jgi:hypothetical protein
VQEKKTGLEAEAGAIAKAYLEHFRAETAVDGDATSWERIDALLHDDARAACMVVEALVSQAATEPELAYVAAGPLEDLLSHHGPSVIGWVEAEAERSAWFKKAIEMVWGRAIEESVRQRLRAMLERK